MTPEDIFHILSTGGFGAFAIDLRQTILFWNEGARRILGHVPDDVLRLPCHQVLSGYTETGLTPQCREGCPALNAARAGLSPAPFHTEMLTVSGSRISLDVTPLAVPGLLQEGPMLVYFFSDEQDQEYFPGFAQALSSLSSLVAGQPSAPWAAQGASPDP